MKRTIIALAALGTFSFATIGANANPVNQKIAIVSMDNQRQEIKYEELPDAVKQAFEESDHATWEVTKVEEVTSDEDIQYDLTVTDGTEEKTLSFDEQGNMIE